MRVSVPLSSLAVLLLISAVATAQERASAAPMPAASMPMDCAAGSIKKHDHGAERNVPGTASHGCAPQPAAPATKAKTKAKALHDHGKVHKNQ